MRGSGQLSDQISVSRPSFAWMLSLAMLETYRRWGTKDYSKGWILRPEELDLAPGEAPVDLGPTGKGH